MQKIFLMVLPILFLSHFQIAGLITTNNVQTNFEKQLNSLIESYGKKFEDMKQGVKRSYKKGTTFEWDSKIKLQGSEGSDIVQDQWGYTSFRASLGYFPTKTKCEEKFSLLLTQIKNAMKKSKWRFDFKAGDENGTWDLDMYAKEFDNCRIRLSIITDYLKNPVSYQIQLSIYNNIADLDDIKY